MISQAVTITDQPQPAPHRPGEPALWDLVIADAADFFDGQPPAEVIIADMRDRDRIGRERYGMPLQANNGRNPLVDAYQEALDQCVYLKQALVEQGGITLQTSGLSKLYFDALYQAGQIRRLIAVGP